MSALATHMMNKTMDKLDIPPIGEFIEMIGDTGAGMYACKASVDMFNLTKDDFVDQVQDIITVGDFYDMAAGGQIIFTSSPFRGGGLVSRPRWVAPARIHCQVGGEVPLSGTSPPTWRVRARSDGRWCASSRAP
jgi:hypothetical protein